MEITGYSAAHLLYETMMRMKVCAVEADSRNGPMEYIDEPVLLTLTNPMQRVVFDPVRDANPFFHMAEAIWMLGGGQGLEFVQTYNSGMARYSDDGATLHGAYGHRWRKHFYRDQILDTIDLIDSDPNTRRAYIAMFDGEVDHGDKLDIPCNVGINFRVNRNNELDMTVFNRSNDVIWGALGANVVHMTILHELMAHATGLSMGLYRVSTACLHGYTTASQYNALRRSVGAVDYYRYKGLRPRPLLQSHETAWDMLEACKRVIAFPWQDSYGVRWLDKTWIPARDAYQARKKGQPTDVLLSRIEAEDWRIACMEWCNRRETKEA